MAYTGVLNQPAPPGMNQSAFDAVEWARKQAEQSFGQGQNLLSQSMLQGPYGQQAAGMAFSPQGFSPAALEAMKSEAAQTIGGASAGQMSNLSAFAGSSGFGGGPEEARLMSEIQAGGGRDLLSAIRELNWLNEQAKLQQQGIGAGLVGQFGGMDTSSRQLAAQGYFNRTFPAYPGVGGTGGGYTYIDPVTGRVKGTPPGGWTQQAYEQMQRERQQWEAQNARS